MIKFKIKTALYTLFLSLHINLLQAQLALPPITEEATDLAHIKAAYSQAGVLSCAVKYQLMAVQTNQPTEALSGILTLSGDDYYFKIAHFEYLKQGNRLLYIDHEQHEMRLFVGSAATAKSILPDAGQFAQLLDREGTEAQLQKIGDKNRKITLNSVKAGIQDFEMWYNTDSYWIERSRMRLPQYNAVVEMHYGQLQKEKNGFGHALSAFIRMKNKQFAPTEAFKNYNFKVMGQ